MKYISSIREIQYNLDIMTRAIENDQCDGQIDPEFLKIFLNDVKSLCIKGSDLTKIENSIKMVGLRMLRLHDEIYNASIQNIICQDQSDIFHEKQPLKNVISPSNSEDTKRRDVLAKSYDAISIAGDGHCFFRSFLYVAFSYNPAEIYRVLEEKKIFEESKYSFLKPICSAIVKRQKLVGYILKEKNVSDALVEIFRFLAVEEMKRKISEKNVTFIGIFNNGVEYPIIQNPIQELSVAEDEANFLKELPFYPDDDVFLSEEETSLESESAFLDNEKSDGNEELFSIEEEFFSDSNTPSLDDDELHSDGVSSDEKESSVGTHSDISSETVNSSDIILSPEFEAKAAAYFKKMSDMKQRAFGSDLECGVLQELFKIEGDLIINLKWVNLAKEPDYCNKDKALPQLVLYGKHYSVLIPKNLEISPQSPDSARADKTFQKVISVSG